MKKESLSVMTVKTLLAVVIFTGLGTIIIGGAYLISIPKIDLPIVNPITEAQCKIDSDCELVYVGLGRCPSPDSSIDDHECFDKDEAIKIRRNKGTNACSFIGRFDRYTCKCENGKCEKVKEELVEEVSITTDKMEYEIGEDVDVVIKNNFSEKIFISYPIVEKRVDSNYVPLRGSIVFWFECGVTGGLMHIPFAPLKGNKYQWDQKEKWCSADFSDRNVYSEDVSSGKYRVKSEIIKRTKSEKEDPNNISGEPSGEFIYSNEFTIKEKSALDSRCGEKVRGVGSCKTMSRTMTGYEFDFVTEKCIVKSDVRGCSLETPFKSLEECQEVCEKNNCAEAGELINYPSGTNKNLPDVCCEGLKALAGFSINENGECEHLKGGPHLTCMPCGNGICETINNFDENKCNCLEDCEKNVNVVLPNNNELIRCGNDNDCVLVDNDWCDCSMGGRMNCINKEYLEDWNQKLKLDHKDSINCPAVYLCDYNFTGCECVNNACQGTGGDFLEMVNEELLKSNQ